MNKHFLSIIIIITVILTALSSCNDKSTLPNNNANKEGAALQFNDQGFLKIAQFTDIHWDNNSENCPKTVASIKHVLEVEKPDVAILTGDIVTKAPAKDGWMAIARIFEETRIHWALTLGNHDAETGVTRCEIFDMLKDYPYFIGEKGPEDISGCGNYALPVYDSKGEKVSAVLYCIDSNDYPTTPRLGHYDWIHFNQIEWYRNTSKAYAKSNGEIPLTSLAFIHIPINEFKNIEGKMTTVGINEEGVACSDINSGFFASLVEMDDVIGVFCGHDHNNDYIGMEKDIALAFGRRSGADSYGNYETGARIIHLYEGKRKFDSWIRTQGSGAKTYYYYPSGLSSVDEATLPLMKARQADPEKQGVAYSYYEGKFSKVADMDRATPVNEGELPNFDISIAQVDDWMGFEYRAWIKIPETGVYRFYTFSDDGSVLYIDNRVVVDNDGSHSERRRDGKVLLEAGFHELKLSYFERYMGEMLEVGYASRNIPETVLPDSILFVR